MASASTRRQRLLALAGAGLLIAAGGAFALWWLWTAHPSTSPVPSRDVDPGASPDSTHEPAPLSAETGNANAGSTSASREPEPRDDPAWLQELHQLGAATLVAIDDRDALDVLQLLAQAASHLLERAPVDRQGLSFARYDNNWGGQPTAFQRQWPLGAAGDTAGRVWGSDGLAVRGGGPNGGDAVLPRQSVEVTWERPIAWRDPPEPGLLNVITGFVVSVSWDHESPEEFGLSFSVEGREIPDGDESVGREFRLFGDWMPLDGSPGGLTVHGFGVARAGGLDRDELSLTDVQLNQLRDQVLELLTAYESRVDRLLAGVPAH